MNNINDVYLFANLLANKQYSGAIGPDEFNLCIPVGQLNYLRGKIGLPELYTVQERQAPQELEAAQVLSDATRKFLTRASLNSSIGEFTIPADFVAYRPSFYLFTWMENGVAKSKRVPLEFLTSGEADLREDNYVTEPTLKYPVISYDTNKLVVRPNTIQDIELRYVRKPTTPIRNYTLNGNDQDTYVPAGSVDFEFPPLEWEMITERVVKYWAVKFREEGLYQTADKAVNTGQ